MATLKSRFEELIHLTWGEFIDVEKGKNTTVDDAILCKLIRLCAETDDIAASKMAFDRIDDPLTTPIQINVPKFYTRYVNAKTIEKSKTKAIGPAEDTSEKSKSTYDPATAKLRETLHEMRDMPQQIVGVVMKQKRYIDQGKPTPHNPMVKSVIVANLLKNVHRGRSRAIEVVFDQIDGKLAKSITLLGGEDVYVDDYVTLEAPAGSVMSDGYYVCESKAMTTAWLRGFANSEKGLSILAEGLEDA